MGYRFRRSVKLGPGVRMTVSKSGVGFSFGGRGLRYTIGSTGRRTLTTGIPGSGLSRSRIVDKRDAPLQRVAAPPKPGLLASHTEKAFHRGVRAMASGDESEALRLFLDAAAADTNDRSVADDLLAGLLLIQTGRGEEAEPFLVKVIESDRGLPDQLMSRYLPAASVDSEIAEGCRVSVPLGSVAAVMALAEIYQDTDRVEDATGLIEQLHETSPEPAIIETKPRRVESGTLRPRAVLRGPRQSSASANRVREALRHGRRLRRRRAAPPTVTRVDPRSPGGWHRRGWRILDNGGEDPS